MYFFRTYKLFFLFPTFPSSLQLNEPVDHHYQNQWTVQKSLFASSCDGFGNQTFSAGWMSLPVGCYTSRTSHPDLYSYSHQLHHPSRIQSKSLTIPVRNIFFRFLYSFHYYYFCLFQDLKKTIHMFSTYVYFFVFFINTLVPSVISNSVTIVYVFFGIVIPQRFSFHKKYL